MGNREPSSNTDDKYFPLESIKAYYTYSHIYLPSWKRRMEILIMRRNEYELRITAETASITSSYDNRVIEKSMKFTRRTIPLTMHRSSKLPLKMREILADSVSYRLLISGEDMKHKLSKCAGGSRQQKPE